MTTGIDVPKKYVDFNNGQVAPRISLTRLVDFVTKSGGPKQTSLAVTKQQLREGYDPATDFYKIIRDAVVAAHAEGLGKRHIMSTASTVHDPKRATNYNPIAKAYTTWWGRKNLGWFPPPTAIWHVGNGFEVIVNPELGLRIDGESHIIKLYFKADKLTKNRVEIITHLMLSELGPDVADGTRFSVLDVRSRKLHSIQPPSYWGPLLQAEMAHLAALWPHV